MNKAMLLNVDRDHDRLSSVFQASTNAAKLFDMGRREGSGRRYSNFNYRRRPISNNVNVSDLSSILSASPIAPLVHAFAALLLHMHSPPQK